ncbi:MAG TPA: HipA domain-containing protein [Thermoanaerobaculia bacterium]
MRRSLDVFLGDILVGRLSEDGEGRVSFRISEDYRRLPWRPVLSQSFEDNLFKVYKGRRREELPAFFANLAPEGPLRELIEKSLQIAPGDQMALLESVGGDLPGAVELRPSVGEPDDANGNGFDEDQAPPDASDESELLRFSLAGVQLKFSVLREGDKLILPVKEKLGEWIVKFDSPRFSYLVENELAMLEWARAAGFEVPECHLQSVATLSPPLRRYADREERVLVIRRYDREGDRRIHQEDFAQVIGLPPRLKYDQITYEKLGKLVKAIVGPEAYFEFVRRLVFVVASGNSDAHLKNWSLLYPDGVEARLAPLYDQVCTIVWPEVSPELSLKLAGLKGLRQVDERSFRRLAESTGSDSAQTLAVLHECLERIARAWHDSVAPEIMPADHAAVLREYWAGVPLLRRHFKPG